MKAVFVFTLCLFTSVLSAQSSFYGRTKGRLPHLEYGLGQDRLGGAKLTYLDSNILVKVIDSSNFVYKVQLSVAHSAYLPKTQFRIDTSVRTTAPYLTASWRVWGDEKYDYVSIGLPERLPYRSQQLINPSKLVVDIFGATSNTNWITQLKTVQEIKNVWHEQLEDDVFRVHIELEHNQHWGHYIYYNNKNLVVRVKRQPKKLNVKKLRVAIDAGHGGSNEGATGLTSRIKEKDYTLKMALALQKQLERKGITVFMTRTDDTDVDMITRTLLLREQDPDLLISLHLNSSGNAAAKGTSTYYRHIGFRSLSQALLDRMLDLKLTNFGNIGAFNFALSGPTEYPNSLVEVAFLSNAEDEKRILDERFHKDVAEQLYKGLKDWVKEVK